MLRPSWCSVGLLGGTPAPHGQGCAESREQLALAAGWVHRCSFTPSRLHLPGAQLGPCNVCQPQEGAGTEIPCMGSYFLPPISLDNRADSVGKDTLMLIQFVLVLGFLLVYL